MTRARCGGRVCSPSTWLIEAEGPGIQSPLQFYSKLGASLAYIRSCLIKLNQRSFGEIKDSLPKITCAVELRGERKLGKRDL